MSRARENRARNHEILTSSGSVEWPTPKRIISLVEAFGGGQIDFDPCGHPSYLYAAITVLLPHYRGDTSSGSHLIWGDGLALPWEGRGLVFCNPPYGRGIDCWVAKARQEADSFIGLVPAKTETAWFHDYVWCADALCFLRGRLRFGQEEGNAAPFPSCLYYWGPEGPDFDDSLQRFVVTFSSLGKVLVQP